MTSHFEKDFLEEIKARVPVSDVVRCKVKLRRQGKRFIGLSPFKNEKTPSFTVDDARQTYHCFSTGKHGDVFLFLQETEGLSFPEAVKQLAAQAGIALPTANKKPSRTRAARESILECLEKAAQFYRQQLLDQPASACAALLRRRSITENTQEEFRLGLAPAERFALQKHLRKEGFSNASMKKAGLVSETENGKNFDLFQDRLMIPICDKSGNVIGFGGRALSEKQTAKYLNSPETELFKKNRVLFNQHRAHGPAWEKKALLIVEGYMDCIACRQAGIENVVAGMGTALTEHQLEKAWRLADVPLLCFDGDDAGNLAADRMIDVALPILKPGKSVRFTKLKDGFDPDDMIRKKGVDQFRRVLANPISLVEALFTRERQQCQDRTPEQLAALRQRMISAAHRIEDVSVRMHYLDDIRYRLVQLATGTDPVSPDRILVDHLIDLEAVSPELFNRLRRLEIDLDYAVTYGQQLARLSEYAGAGDEVPLSQQLLQVVLEIEKRASSDALKPTN